MKQLPKKKMQLKKREDCGHFEGKYWCDCRTRNIRKYLGIKRYGREEEMDSEGDQASRCIA
jgi:hypothetical protein